ncbi:MAG: hypothetical protein Q9M89_04305 [Persephonella sp.]|nr:hypothetical protein [Persephonella sp.]
MKKLVVASILAAAPFAAFAGTASDDFTVTATVDPYCEIVSGASDVSVSYNPFDSSDVSETTTTEFNCVMGTNYTINVVTDGSLEGSGTSATLTFTATPSATSGTDTDGLTGTEAVDIAITIPAGQNVPVDVYSDTVTVEIGY